MGHYLVTGAAGFIAAAVTRQLLGAGHRVTGLDNLNDAYDVRLKHWRLRQLVGRPGFEFVHADICDRAALADLWNGRRFDAVINLAARAGIHPSVQDPWIYLDTNVTGNLNLLDGCRQHGIPKYILASSSSLYGLRNSLPYSETADTSGPISPYAATKKAAEVMCYTYHALYGLDVTIFRYFTVYGPAGRPDMSPLRFVQWISEGRSLTLFGDGSASRDFTYVDDIARGTLAGLRPLGYEIINLGSDAPLTMREAVAVMETAIGRPAQIVHLPARPADVLATWADIRKAQTLLDWRPEISFAQGVERLVRWYQDNRELARELRTD